MDFIASFLVFLPWFGPLPGALGKEEGLGIVYATVGSVLMTVLMRGFDLMFIRTWFFYADLVLLGGVVAFILGQHIYRWVMSFRKKTPEDIVREKLLELLRWKPGVAR